MLYSSGFSFTSRKKSFNFYTKDSITWRNKLSKIVVFSEFEKEYLVEKQLGKGKYATVSLAIRNDCQYAAKSIDKEKLLENKRTFSTLFNEISVLRDLDHDSVIKLYEIYETSKNVILILEYLQGGELFMKIKRNGYFTEEIAAEIMRELLTAIDYVHTKNIIHRDLKPENIILM